MSAAPELPPRQVQDLLDFVLLYETDRAQSRVRPLAAYASLFPNSRAEIEAEYHRLEGPAENPTTQSEGSEFQPVAHYVIERELGRGGQGRVYLAFDPRMRRRVALKVLSSGRLAPDRLRRFRREVAVIAKLDHQGLCAVYEADLDGPTPYLAMRYVEGGDLASKIKAARDAPTDSDWIRPRTALDLSRALHVIERAARALHSAHEAGVVHRDVKPANILVRKDGEPVLVDFGLARGDDSEFQTITATDDHLGTPAYMAPEMIESGDAAVDRRADVYALGVTLYECLTLERPFQSPTREAVFQRITAGDYTEPRRLNPLISPDLAIVIATAMERDPARRYSTALDLAEDLRRVREYEPIRARPATWGLRTRRWMQRHPRFATALAVLCLSVSMWMTTLWITLKQVEAREREVQSKNDRLLGVEFRERSGKELRSNRGFALALALEAESRDPGFESNMAMLRALDGLHEQRTLPLIIEALDDAPETFDISSDGYYLGVCTSHRRGCVFDLANDRWIGAPVNLTSADVGRGDALAKMLADGKSVLVSRGAGSVSLLDCATGTLRRQFELPLRRTAAVDATPDGRLLLISQLGVESVSLFDMDSGSVCHTLVPLDPCTSIARFDADAQQILTTRGALGAEDCHHRESSTIQIWDVTTGVSRLVLRGHAPARDTVFTPDGHWVVSVDRDGVLESWSTADGRRRWEPVRLPGEGWRIAFHPDGSKFAVGYKAGVRVFDAANAKHLFDLEDLDKRSVLLIRFSPDGDWIAAQDYGGTVGAWSAVDGSKRFVARNEGRKAGGLAWFPDSRRFASSSGNTLRIWSLDPIAGFVNLEPHSRAVRSAVFDPTSSVVLSAGRDGVVKLSSIRDGTMQQSFDVETHGLLRAWFIGGTSGDIGCLSDNGDVFRIDPIRAVVSRVHSEAHRGVSASAVGPNGATLAMGHHDGTVVWIETSSGNSLARFDPTAGNAAARINSVAISTSGECMVWGSQDGRVGFVERTGASRWQLHSMNQASGDSAVYCVGLSRNARWVIASGDFAQARIWRAGDGAFLGTVPLRAFAEVVSLSHGEEYVFISKSAADMNRVTIRDSDIEGAAASALASDPSGRDRESRGSRVVQTSTRWGGMGDSADGRATLLRVSHDERRLLTASEGGVAELWECDTGKRYLRFEHGSSAITAAEFSPDDQWIVTGAADGSIRIWPVEVRAVAKAHCPGTLDVYEPARGNSPAGR